MPPQLPSFSWRSIDPMRDAMLRVARAAAAKGGLRRTSADFRRASASPSRARVCSSGSLPGRTISEMSTPSSRTGFFETTMVSGATVPRAQQAKSYKLNGIHGGK